jgi:AAA family ATP:ADP antiporter
MGSPLVLMLAAATIFSFSLVLTHLVHERSHGRAHDRVESRPHPVGGANAFGLVLRDRYLCLIGVLIMTLNVVTKTGDYVLDRMLLAHAGDAARSLGVAPLVYVGQFKAHYFASINTAGMLLQLFFVSRVIKYAGLRSALVVIPIVSLGGYGAALFAPALGMLFAGRVVESSLDYSLSNTSRQALWLVTSREAKYKAKQVVDTVLVRLGDASSAALVWAGTRVGLGSRAFLGVNVALSIAWVIAAFFVGKEHARRSSTVGSDGGETDSAARL